MRAIHVLKSAALGALLTLALIGLVAPLAHAGLIFINNTNAPGVGFNDPAPRAPVGGNPATTLGGQRLYIFNYAAAIWGATLPDNVTITINASMAAQTCSPSGATLGSTSSNSFYHDFPGAPVPGHWFKQTLANKLANADQNAGLNDMTITFNLSLDTGCLSPTILWYYGTDGNEGTNIEMLSVVLHEIGHGLGFATLTSGTSGNYNGGFPDIFDKFLFDRVTSTHWDTNTPAQRAASAIALDKLVWDGPASVQLASTFLIGQARVLANAPGGIAGQFYTAQDATFGASLTTPGLSGNVVLLIDDNSGGVGSTNPNDGCDPITNAGALAGNIALIDRGICTFVVKCAAAQAAGATGVIIVNNVAAGLPGMGGTDPTITIPCVGISQADGNTIKANLASGVNVTIGRDAVVKAGADNVGRIKMYTPNPFAGGSSVSHWDISLSPNALMEPNINQDLHDSLDLTYTQMRDIGWFPAYVGAVSTTTTICPSNPCVTLPVNIQRFDSPTPIPMLGYSVTLQLSANLSLCGTGITEGNFLSQAGGTSFQVVNNGGGSYTVDGVVFGPFCGPTAQTGNLFNVAVTSAAAGGTGSITVTAVQLRDCNNNPLQAMPNLPGTVPIDNQAPVVTVTSPNGGESWTIGSTQNITWIATDNTAVTSVDLAYSTDGGATYPNVIATGLPNSGTYAWLVPNTPTTTARVRATAYDACLSGADASDADFSILNPTVTILASAGAGGSISPSGAVVVPYGGTQSFTISANACFSILDVLVDGSSVGPVSSYTFVNAITNHTIAASFAPNTTPPGPVTGLSAAQVKLGNDGDGTTKTTLTFSAPGGTTVEVWRKGYGSYPTYDDGGGSPPSPPGSYPPAGWTLTGVTTSGQTDEAATRDDWYFVAYAKDVCGNVSSASNLTGGTLGYHLGDVSDGITPSQGDNKVTTADISLLGMHYGLTGGALAGYEYLDVGPTTDTTPDGRPTTDTKTNFEDLVIYAINYTPRVSLATKGGVSTQVAGENLIALGGTDAVLAGEFIEVPVQLSGAGDLQAISVALRWDAKVVEPVSISTGDYLTTREGIALSPTPGTVDAALLGVTGRGMSGQGVLATVRFRALAAGDPAIGIDRVIGRNSRNAAVQVKVAAPVALARAATKTDLQPVVPNPSRGISVLAFSLAAESHVDLSIYSVDGRKIRSVFNGIQPAGSYRVTWNGTDEQGTPVKAGVYFVQFQGGGVAKTRPVTLVR